jgi:hypothetical protein
MNFVRFTILICLFLTSQQGFSQKLPVETTRHSVFLELLGNAPWFSLNYEYFPFQEINMSIRTGIGYYTETRDKYPIIPLSVQYLPPVGKTSFIEAGIGYTLIPGRDALSELPLFFIPSLGYRIHFGRNDLWKVNFSPQLTFLPEERGGFHFFPFIGMSYGKRFR